MKLVWTKTNKIVGGLRDGQRKPTEYRADGLTVTYAITTLGRGQFHLHSRFRNAVWRHDLCRGALKTCQAKAQEIEDAAV